MEKRILIRADGNAGIGMGHLMRCMTIAEELALLQGGKDRIRFVCADEDSGAFARENGFLCHVLGTDYRDMESELPLWEEIRGKQVSGQRNPPGKGIVALVDSYYVTDTYLAALQKTAWTVLMDDMGTHRYPADCVVNYNAPADPEAYRRLYQDSGTRLLIGSRYTPLRRQFRGKPGEEPEPEVRKEPAGNPKPGVCETGEDRSGNAAISSRRMQVREILITTGGGDSENIAGKILERIYDEKLSFHLVLGRFSPHFRKMRELAEAHGNIPLHHDVKDMAGLMRRCQIAITAGGSTIYELAALGIPFICFSYAENQEALADYIGTCRIAASAGAWHREPEQTLCNIETHFRELALRPELREQYTQNETGMVDGEGASRLARAIIRERNL